MKRVLLISPPVRNQNKVDLIPYGLLSIGGFLRKYGYEVRVYNSAFPYSTPYQVKIERTNQVIKDFVPDFIGLGFPTDGLESAVTIAKNAKKINQDIIIIIGGIHPTAQPIETLAIPYFDYLVSGEGEITAKELLDALIANKNTGLVKGIAYKSEGRIISNEPRTEILDLDEIPFANRDLLIDLEKYPKSALGQIHTSRGCPYQCAYCSSAIIWKKKVRFRSVANVLQEIDYLYNQYQVRKFNFADDNFLLEPERVRMICQELIKRRYQIQWRCCARADIHHNFNLDLLRLIRKSGGREICIGFESGSQFILDAVSRQVKLSETETFLKLMKDAKIKLHADFIIGLPGENKETLDKTFQLMKKVWQICQPMMSVALFKPYPGTTAYQQKEAINYSHLTSEFKNLFAFAESCNIKRLARSPSYVSQKLLKNLKSPKKIWQLIAKGIRAWI
ncbi:MAG: radical SAM protein [candidate division WOR-3 bacterium]